MRFIFGIAAIALAVACTPAATTETAAVSGCQAAATETWTPADGADPLTIEANSSGPDCAHAIATLTVRDASNDVMFADVFVTEQVMLLAGVADAAAMQTALAEWIDSDRPAFATTSALPDWPQGAESPDAGEFPFHVDEGLAQADYLALRSRGVPTLCYVQGMESLNCLALENEQLTPIGVQQFPG